MPSQPMAASGAASSAQDSLTRKERGRAPASMAAAMTARDSAMNKPADASGQAAKSASRTRAYGAKRASLALVRCSYGIKSSFLCQALAARPSHRPQGPSSREGRQVVRLARSGSALRQAYCCSKVRLVCAIRSPSSAGSLPRKAASWVNVSSSSLRTRAALHGAPADAGSSVSSSNRSTGMACA